MALTTYTEIANKVSEWLNREGHNSISTNVEDFIIVSQRRIMRDIRTPTMETSSVLSITDGQATIPSDMLDVKEMIAENGTSAWDVRRSTFGDVKTKRLKNTSGPVVFDTVAGNFEFGPEPSSGVTVTLIYYKEINFITSSVATNWFSLYAGELILYGALSEAAIFLKDTAMADVYDEKFRQALADLKEQRRKAEYSGLLQVNNR